ncbi:hypothetical protein WOB59_00915 [Methylocystis sp. IM4]|uniref:hypothetical protein n=1 Tax=Methylocystis sp. IM4 TaxID=3136560 RepID=UPI003119CE12
MLPLFVLTGEALWREVKGEGFGLTTAPDEGALLGCRLTTIGTSSFTGLMLATMEALAQAAGPNGIIVEELDRVWRESTKRHEADRQGAEAQP